MAGRKPGRTYDCSALTKAEIARMLEVTAPAVAKWAAAGCPCQGTGGASRFTLAAVVNWRIEQAKGRKQPGAAAESDRELTRWRRARRRLVEMELARRRGKLLDAGEVTKWVAGLVSDANRMLSGIPDRVGLLVADPALRPTVVEQCRVVVNGALRLLAKAVGRGGRDRA